jgi:hypothetical protein
MIAWADDSDVEYWLCTVCGQSGEGRGFTVREEAYNHECLTGLVTDD